MLDASILLLATALALDACVVAVGARASGRAGGGRALFRLSFHFGLFQGLMPVAGWYAGRLVADLVAAYDHWIAFAILAVVGGRMAYEGLRGDDDAVIPDPSRGVTLVMLSVATSIDALAVGFGLAVVQVPIWGPAVVIGLVTGGLVALAGLLGDRLGARFGRHAEVAGGAILVLVGLRLLTGHVPA